MKGRVFKIGISGSYGGMNLGDEAILQSIIAQIRHSPIQAEFTVFTQDPEDTRKRHHVERAVPVRDFSLNEIKPEIARLDLFVLGGGGILYDADAKTYLRELVIAKEKKVPTMLYAIGAGPLNEPSVQEHVRQVLNEVDMLTVREREAQRILESVGVTKDIMVTADPALLMQPESLPEGTLVKEHLENKRRLIGLSVREPGSAAPDLDEKEYHALLANTADFLVDHLDADIILIPMERKTSYDVQHSHAVISQMLQPQRANVLKNEYTSGQILSIIGLLDFAVGMRLHFLIFAALQKVPFVALPYASKVTGLLQDFGLQFPPLNLVNAGRLIAHIDNAWDNKEELRDSVKEKLPAIQQRAKQTHEALLSLLNRLYA